VRNSDVLKGIVDPYKRQAIECWSADPCGAVAARGDLDKRTYFEQVLAARAQYAPWISSALAYEDAKGMHVLDVGCGQGIDLAQYARAGARAVGVDLTPAHVQLARDHLAAMALPSEALVGDAEHLPFADNAFDLVSSNGVLHHTPRIDQALREIRRVLRPGSEARIILYNRNSFHYWLGQVLVRGVLRAGLIRGGSMSAVLSRGVEHSSTGAQPLVRVYSPDQVRRLLLDTGFRDITVRVHHLGSARLTSMFEALLGVKLGRALANRLGEVGGWYVVACGVA
jgi:ubiquinone/menaquinone biosynthesis C-methylase UbiE